MFAFVVPGRLVQQTVQDPTSPERFLAQIEQSTDLNHITVFLTGQAPFPEGYGATVHLEIPGKGFQLIGGLSNEKPSAIFRLRGTLPSPSTSSFTPSSSSEQTGSSAATLGILCSPLSEISQQLSLLPSSSSTSTALVPTTGGSSQGMMSDPVKLAQLVGKNLFNALSGFVREAPGGVGGGSWLEFGQVEGWYRNFERKLNLQGIGFLNSE